MQAYINSVKPKFFTLVEVPGEKPRRIFDNHGYNTEVKIKILEFKSMIRAVKQPLINVNLEVENLRKLRQPQRDAEISSAIVNAEAAFLEMLEADAEAERVRILQQEEQARREADILRQEAEILQQETERRLQEEARLEQEREAELIRQREGAIAHRFEEELALVHAQQEREDLRLRGLQLRIENASSSPQPSSSSNVRRRRRKQIRIMAFGGIV